MFPYELMGFITIESYLNSIMNQETIVYLFCGQKIVQNSEEQKL